MTDYILPNFGGKLMSTRVSTLLIAELKDGVFKTAEKLPAELDLSERLGVSRTVIRDALADLECEGLIERVRGIGTVINRDIVNLKCRLDLKFEYNQIITDCGATPKSDSIIIRVEHADESLAQRLMLDVGANVIVCEKRMLASGVPVIYSIDYISMGLFSDMDYRDIDWSLPIFDIFETYCGLTVITDIAKITATNGCDKIRAKLNVPNGQSLIMLDEIGYCKLSRPVLRSLEYYTDFFEFTMLRKKF